MREEEIIKASIVYMNNEIDATFDDNKNHEDDKVCSFREIEIAFKEGAKWALVNQWNAETKQVEDIENKYFKPKDWCLMRTASDYAWCLCQFSNMDSDSYVAIGGAMHEYCIPYNDETKHILGTTEDAPEKYKTW